MNNQDNNYEERSNSFFDELMEEDLLPKFDDMKSQQSESVQSQLKELSFYALDVENIEDLVKKQKITNTHQITSLRIMHCNQLTSLKGIHLFSKVKELNLSSNGLMSMSFLESLTCVETLNLSCNKIT